MTCVHYRFNVPPPTQMELRQLRYFTVLAEELNFTRAAARLHISQPPLSAQIAQLEDELGVSLFLRDSRRVQLTDAGTAFLHDVRRIQAQLQDATQRVRTVHAGLAGRLEVGLSGSHFLGPLPDIIRQLADHHPDIDVVLNELAPNDQIQALRASRIDVSISRQPVDDDLLSSHALWPDDLVVALPLTHPLANRATLTLTALADEAFVMLRRETSLFAEQLLQACAAAGFTPRTVQTVAEVPAQLSLVAAGLGIALVPASTQGYQAHALVFIPLTGTPLSSGVYAVMRHDKHRPVVDTFVRFLTEYAGAHPPPQLPK